MDIPEILGLVVSLIVILSMQLKNVRHILVCQLLINGIGALTYVLQDGFSGCGIYLVALVQTVVYFILRVKKISAPTMLAAVFAVLFVLCSAVAYTGYADIISAVAALSCALGIAQNKPSNYRICMLLNGLIWMAYDITLGAYTMIISHAVTFLSAGIGIVRLDLKTSKENKGDLL